MKKQVLLFVLMLMPLIASAATKINGIYYNLNSTNKVAEVTSVPSGTSKYTGSITIPNTVTYGGETYSVASIGGGAFSSCTGMTSITLPSSITFIGLYAFSGCSGLTSVQIDDISAWCKIQFENWFYPNEYDREVLVCDGSNPLLYAKHFYLNGEEVKKLIIPENVLYINSFAFLGFKGESVSIPNSVTSIGYGAFKSCSGLTSINIPNSVTSIADETFDGCKKLTSIVIPNSVTSIGYNAFSGCSGITSLSISNSVKFIGESAFSGCSGLIFVTIPNSVTSIGRNAFSGCTSLPVVNNCRYADSYLVQVVDKTITSCVIKEGTRFIGDSAFRGCSDLTSITIPKSVVFIGEYAFENCTGLNSVHITDLAAWCKIGFPLYYWDNSEGDCSNPLFYAHHLYLNGEEVKDLVIPSGLTRIGDNEFIGCSSFTSMDIPNSVTSIGERAFYGCSGLTSITIPDSVTSIGVSAFYKCTSLTSVTIPNSVTKIIENTFYGCNELSSVSLGSGINSIGSKAFANCPEIKEVYCYAKDVPTISNDTFENSYYIKFATLYVPESSVDLYKASAWSQFGNIVGITGGNEGERCEKPVITLLANGKIKVESATEGATCVTNITASNVEPLSDGEISLNTPLTVYTVTSYATKEGYDDSEVATATFRYEKAEGDMNGDGMLNITDVIYLVNMILSK